MAITVTYTLVATIAGENESECETGEQGAGEARKMFEQQLETLKMSAASTSMYTASLTEV